MRTRKTETKYGTFHNLENKYINHFSSVLRDSLVVTFTSDGLCPEAEEILERRESHEEAVGEAVEEEEDEVLDQSEGSITLCVWTNQRPVFTL